MAHDNQPTTLDDAEPYASALAGLLTAKRQQRGEGLCVVTSLATAWLNTPSTYLGERFRGDGDRDAFRGERDAFRGDGDRDAFALRGDALRDRGDADLHANTRQLRLLITTACGYELVSPSNRPHP